MQCIRTILLLSLLFELFPFIKFSCPGNNSKTIEGTLLKLHKILKDIERKYSVQEP